MTVIFVTHSISEAAFLANRAVVLARAKMDELLVNDALPRNQFVDGLFSGAEAGAINTGWPSAQSA